MCLTIPQIAHPRTPPRAPAQCRNTPPNLMPAPVCTPGRPIRANARKPWTTLLARTPGPCRKTPRTHAAPTWAVRAQLYNLPPWKTVTSAHPTLRRPLPHRLLSPVPAASSVNTWCASFWKPATACAPSRATPQPSGCRPHPPREARRAAARPAPRPQAPAMTGARKTGSAASVCRSWPIRVSAPMPTGSRCWRAPAPSFTEPALPMCRWMPTATASASSGA